MSSDTRFRLPDDFAQAIHKLPSHRLLAIITADTQLTLAEVRGEQRRRAPLQKPLPEGAGLSWNAGPVR